MGYESGVISDSEDDVLLRPLAHIARESTSVTEPPVESLHHGQDGTGTALESAHGAIPSSPPLNAIEYDIFGGIQSLPELSDTEEPPIVPSFGPLVGPPLDLQSSDVECDTNKDTANENAAKESAVANESTVSMRMRSMRKRNINQLRPYTYDKRKYGDINYTSSLDSSPKRTRSSYSNLDSLSQDAFDYGSDVEDVDELDELGDEMPPALQESLEEMERWERRWVIDSSDNDLENEDEPDPLPELPDQSQQPAELEPESVSEASDTQSEPSEIEPEIRHFEHTLDIVDLTDSAQVDFLNVAARTYKLNGAIKRSAKKYMRQSANSRGLEAQEARSTVRTARQTKRSERAKKFKQSMLPRQPRQPKAQGHLKEPGRPKEQSIQNKQRNKQTRLNFELGSRKDVLDSAARPKAMSKEPKQPKKPKSKQAKKRIRDAAARLLNVTVTSSRVPQRLSAPQTVYHNPIVQEEDGTFYYPVRPEPQLADIVTETDANVALPLGDTRGRSANNPQKYIELEPISRRFLLGSFIGSNTLTMPTNPEPWNGQSSHADILDRTSILQLRETFALYEAYLIDEEIQAQTFESMYSWLLQLGAELLRQDTLVEESTRLMILDQCCDILNRVNAQIDCPPMAMRARFLFALFSLCVGYSAPHEQDKYGVLQRLVIQFVEQNVSTVIKTIRALHSKTPAHEHVAFELVVVMYRLDVWPSVMKAERTKEQQWQFIEFDACIKHYERQQLNGGWDHVLKLLSTNALKQQQLLSVINRCILLVTKWKWPLSKELAPRLFDFIARYRKYADPYLEALEIPALIWQGSFNGRLHNNEWHAFLELLGMSFLAFRGRRELIGLRQRTTPLSVVQNIQDPTIESISGAAQRYAIMLVEMRTCSGEVRPSVQQALGATKLETSHIALRAKALEAWGILTRVVEAETDISACGRWLASLVNTTVHQYNALALGRAGQDSGHAAGHADVKSIKQLQLFFVNLYTILLDLPNAACYYTGEMITPLDFGPTPQLKSLIWRIVQQFPLKELQKAYPILSRYFYANEQPIHIWIQTLARLQTPKTYWPHPNSEPAFLAELLRKIPISLDVITPRALEFLARPSWTRSERHFFNILRFRFGLPSRSRAAIAAALVTSRVYATMMLHNVRQVVESSELDAFERHMYSATASTLRAVCLDKFPELAERYQVAPSAEQSRNTIRNYIMRDQLQTLEYFLGHKIRLAITANNASGLVKELLDCISLEDRALAQRVFGAVVNRVFAFYVCVGRKRPRMHSFLPLFLDIVMRATSFSDRFDYDPRVFVASMVHYTRAYLLNPLPLNWAPVSLLFQLGALCVRQIYVSGETPHEWQQQLQDLEALAAGVHAKLEGRMLPTIELSAVPTAPHGEISAVEDFASLDVEHAVPALPIKQSIERFETVLAAVRDAPLLL